MWATNSNVFVMMQDGVFEWTEFQRGSRPRPQRFSPACIQYFSEEPSQDLARAQTSGEQGISEFVYGAAWGTVC